MNSRNGALDLYKFIAALLMALFHTYKFAPEDGVSFFKGGALLVEFFFIISGFFLAAAAMRDIQAKPDADSQSIAKDTVQFMKRKYLALCPEYYVAWVMNFILIHTVNRELHILKDLSTSVWSLLLINQTGMTGYDSNPVTWYIGAMLVVFLIFYPMIRRYRDTWFYIIAPLLWVFLMGYSYQIFKNLSAPHFWAGWYFKGMLRAVMDIALGTICYKIAAKLNKFNFRNGVRILLSLISMGTFAMTIAYLWNHSGNKRDWVVVLLFAVTITITASGTGALSRKMNHPAFAKLGALSYCIYLGHYGWAVTISTVLPKQTYLQLLPTYLVGTLISTLIIYFASNVLRHLWKKIRPAIKNLLLEKA